MWALVQKLSGLTYWCPLHSKPFKIIRVNHVSGKRKVCFHSINGLLKTEAAGGIDDRSKVKAKSENGQFHEGIIPNMVVKPNKRPFPQNFPDSFPLNKSVMALLFFSWRIWVKIRRVWQSHDAFFILAKWKHLLFPVLFPCTHVEGTFHF